MIRALWLVLGFCLHLQARTFQNSYIRWNLPDNWSCVQEKFNWVCAPSNPSDAREALIVVTAKVAGPEDNLNSFLKYLKQPKTVISKSKSILSQPLSIDRRSVSGTEWVQATHRGSEIPGFLTRYMATVKQKLAVLVSFSADEGSTSKYNPIFETAINSMQIDPGQALLNQMQRAAADAMVRNEQRPANVAPVPGLAQSRTKRLLELSLIAIGLVTAALIIRKLV